MGFNLFETPFEMNRNPSDVIVIGYQNKFKSIWFESVVCSKTCPVCIINKDKHCGGWLT